jgi:uncharacterized repeat protein (TIGR04138 family)
MDKEQYEKQLEALSRQPGGYPVAAYRFVTKAVAFTAQQRRAEQSEASRHISGQELLEGIRHYALDQFGPLALDVFADWGITETEHFGEIVFTLVRHNLLGASEEDSIEDFADGYDFRQVFLRPFAAPPAADMPPTPIA